MAETSVIARDSWFSHVVAVVAIVALTLGSFLLGGRNGTTQTQPSRPGVVFASISMDCGGKKFAISTGTDAGLCNSTIDENGATTGMKCGDGGNTAEAKCNKGNGSCTSSSGKGSCTMPE